MTIGWCFDNTYSKLPDPFKEKIGPVPVSNPELVILNEDLSKELDLDFSNLDNRKISELFSGNSLPPGSNSIAQAYACLLYTSPSPRDMRRSRMPSSA